jgi:hypothetical protein
MKLEIRKIISLVEDTLIEGGRAAPRPLRMAASAVVIRNPWAGGFVEDLVPTIHAYAQGLADALIPRLLANFPSPDAIEAYGKAAVVGVNGEVEHAAGLIHTLHFGNEYRKAANANGFLPFTNKRGAPGCSITFPMTHKREENKGTRSHFLSLEFSIPDAPGPDEIVVALGAADGGRPHHRIGDRFRDMREMGVDQAGKALAGA